MGCGSLLGKERQKWKVVPVVQWSIRKERNIITFNNKEILVEELEAPKVRLASWLLTKNELKTFKIVDFMGNWDCVMLGVEPTFYQENVGSFH